eukprot:Plantae.Rhodophyta-Purpureofilum_apyrenoidigerum.ctg8242.p1 GENE.Plantae.Rhodophyta-Purpureofilum_apyrenoidigerum.ctg8242~~Plantae.Rhodophyta-Purpureofilum_apyrenoidigerum.ctg8242.p1  ORF type:complete len:459 (-),score=91.22 Plantae.Rhodophyta-Purpureofilum_apyrenoidigerum.ctg8242:908-2284(-)
MEAFVGVGGVLGRRNRRTAVAVASSAVKTAHGRPKQMDVQTVPKRRRRVQTGRKGDAGIVGAGISKQERAAKSFSGVDGDLDCFEASLYLPNQIEKDEGDEGGEFGQANDGVDSDDTNLRRDGDQHYKDSLRSYLSEIRRYEMLQHSEELELSRRVKKLLKVYDMRKSLLDTMGRPPKFSEWASALEVSNNELEEIVLTGTAAKQSLVTANLRLVNSVVNKMGRRNGKKVSSVKMQDLLQEGVFGLIRAAEKFDGDKGYRFSTYATYWVSSFISRALQIIDRPVKVPARVHETYFKTKKMYKEYLRNHAHPPSEENLAEMVGVTPAKMRFCLQHVQRSVLSTDIGISRDGNTTMSLSDLLDSGEDISETMVDRMFKLDLDSILKKYLNPKERAALRLRYGLDDGGERTLGQIGKVLDISSERTRQIIFDSLVKLRKHEVRKELQDYLLDCFPTDNCRI